MTSRASTDLMLLPGFLCDADLWRDQVAGLADLARCQVADLTQGDSIAELARQTLALAPARFALAGFSFGGYVAQEMLRQAPERVERLALLDTSIDADTPERATLRRTLSDAARMPGRFAGITDRMLPTFVHPARLTDADLIGRLKAMTRRLGREVFLRQNAMQRVDGADLIRALRCPVLVLCGEQDALTPPQKHRELAEMIASARLVSVPDSGHMTPMEQPRAVTEALRSWLAQEVS
jgi:pimeloyl-ACP methyl ester carboxylesterase